MRAEGDFTDRPGPSSADRAPQGPIDKMARGLARGMSRRDALRAGAAMLFAGLAVDSADAFAATKHHCPKHKTRCKGKCVNTARDPHNCGRCGHVCKPGHVCSHGKCVKAKTTTTTTTTNSNPNCQHPGTACGQNSDCCSNSCNQGVCN